MTFNIIFDEERNATYGEMIHNGKPIFSLELLTEIKNWMLIRHDTAPDYAVFASANPSVFCLGGDLTLFADAIESGRQDVLYEYGMECVKMLHLFDKSLCTDTTTISLIRGKAYGGGIESALSANIIVAEESASIKFPEHIFGMFPGMGAYHYLDRRVGRNLAIKMIESGKTFTGEELYKIGVVDLLAKHGQGLESVWSHIAKDKGNRYSHLALRKIASRTDSVSLKYLEYGVELWVNAAFKLNGSQIKKMRKLARLQENM